MSQKKQAAAYERSARRDALRARTQKIGERISFARAQFYIPEPHAAKLIAVLASLEKLAPPVNARRVGPETLALITELSLRVDLVEYALRGLLADKSQRLDLERTAWYAQRKRPI